MAGNYPDAIGPRIPYDRDGTVGVLYNVSSGSLTQQSQAILTGINDESSAGTAWGLSAGAAYWSGFIFPAAVDLVGYFVAHGGNSYQWSFGAIQTSTNTTNLSDGTWTQVAASHAYNSSVSPTYRTGQISLAAPGIKAIRFYNSPGGGSVGLSWIVMQLYGRPSATSDRLELWHPTLDQSLNLTPAYFDYGDVARGTGPVTKGFRIKNLSTSLTANSITVGVEAPTDSSAPTYVSQTQFSYNGGSYASTAGLASLAPTAISQPFTAKLDVSASAILGVWAQRYYAQAGSWS
jgi:hypothetical protein